MKTILMAVLFSLACTSAYSMEFVLNCSPSLEGVSTRLTYQVVKVSVPGEGGWVTSYKVRATTPSIVGFIEFALKPAQSGDEDYNEYKIVDPRNISGLSGAAIQNRFAWVSLVNNEGLSAYDCRKEN